MNDSEMAELKREREYLKKAIAKRLRPRWHPISEAPKDREILGAELTQAGWEYTQLLWSEDRQCWHDPFYGELYEPTHWMILEEPDA